MTARQPARRPRPRRWLSAAVSSASLLAGTVVFAGCLAAADSPQALRTRSGRAAPGRAMPVGALFATGSGHLGAHFCTGSVVHSSQGNLVITAAHCLGKNLQPGSVVFAPGYSKGHFPLGLWDVVAVFVTPRWTAARNPNDDVAFLAVSRPGVTLEQMTGAEYLRTDLTLPAAVQVVGYPSAADEPVSCTANATAFDTPVLKQLKFVCPGYTDGTSGGPFLYRVDRRTGQGQVIGVIGGYQEGGDTPQVSYSVAFQRNVAALYRVAEAWTEAFAAAGPAQASAANGLGASGLGR